MIHSPTTGMKVSLSKEKSPQKQSVILWDLMLFLRKDSQTPKSPMSWASSPPKHPEQRTSEKNLRHDQLTPHLAVEDDLVAIGRTLFHKDLQHLLSARDTVPSVQTWRILLR